MIDICMVVHKNYWLLDKQLSHWRDHFVKGSYRLLIADNTPDEYYVPFYYKGSLIQRYKPSNAFDGTSHGETLDFLISQAESGIVGTLDTDFFWLNPDIIEDVEMYMDFHGYKAVGASAFYKDWVNNIDAHYPERNSGLAPACWGMFTTKELAQKFTFVCTPEEGSQRLYTGWRLRQHIIENDIKRLTFQGYYPYNNDDQTIAYGEFDKPQGIHFLKGSAARAHMVETLLPKYIEEGKAKWQ